MTVLLRIAFSVVLALTLASCASAPEEEEREREPAPAATDSPRDVPDEVAQALLPPEDRRAGRASEPQAERFDINVDAVPARSFFMGLVRDTPYNMVVHPDVGGTISLRLNNVSVEDVLEITRDMYGYDYRQTRTGYMIMPAALQSRVFPVNFLNVNRSGKSETRVSSGAITDSDAGQQGSRGRGQVGGLQGGTVGSREQRAVAGTRIETESESEFWKELKETLTAIVGQEEGRRVVISPDAGLVVARAMPSELRELDDYLRQLQDNLYRQVILEAKVIEVELKDEFQAGINWGALARTGDLGDVFIGQMSSGVDPLVPPGSGPRTDVFGQSDIDGGFGMTGGGRDFIGVLQALSTQGDVQVLSSPRVSTVNNQKAVIKVGQDEFFVTGVDRATVASTATTTSQNVQLTPFFSGIALDVTPQISRSGEVVLHIHPSVSEVTESLKTFTLGGQTESLPLALSTVRETDSIVRARSGQVVVIGGLMQEQQDETYSGVPLLKDIPLLGGLFRQTRIASSKSELVILLRPIVVDSDADWEREIEQRRRSIGPEFWPEGY